MNYKTPNAIRRIHNLNVSVQKKSWSLEKLNAKISQELKPKKEYMQSDAFWNDEHNKKMFALSEVLMNLRDKIGQNIAKNNSLPFNNPQFQDVNGFARVKKFWQPSGKSRHNKQAFVERVSVGDRENYDYSFIKTRMYNLSREFLSKIGR